MRALSIIFLISSLLCQLLFIVMYALDIINWEWYFVFAPLEFYILVIIFIALGGWILREDLSIEEEYQD